MERLVANVHLVVFDSEDFGEVEVISSPTKLGAEGPGVRILVLLSGL